MSWQANNSWLGFSLFFRPSSSSSISMLTGETHTATGHGISQLLKERHQKFACWVRDFVRFGRQIYSIGPYKSEEPQARHVSRLGWSLVIAQVRVWLFQCARCCVGSMLSTQTSTVIETSVGGLLSDVFWILIRTTDGTERISLAVLH